jgi:hypothetical protein
MFKTKETFLAALLIAALADGASAYAVDGSLSDWGVDLAHGLGGNASAWAPSSKTADWKVEDNIDPECAPNTGIYGPCQDWDTALPGYNSRGVHVEGHGHAYVPYAEPASIVGGRKYDGPAGGEPYDLEAVYFDDVPGYAYFAIVTSMPEAGHTDRWGRHTDTGDLALDLDLDPSTGQYGYEYGIKTSGPDRGRICYLPKWTLPNAANGFPSNAPSTMSCDGPSSENRGKATMVYKGAGAPDHTFDNYVIEVKVDKRSIGLPPKGEMGDLHTAITCGNDVIEIGHYSYDYPAPEFQSAAAAFLVLAVAPLAAYLAARKAG